ncbi:UNVERIFIED_CONTAM: hypothetical protein Slati_0038300 [Sesamum latifolium]|uniref:Transmembrane protein n=1 Tax=Sesamum latifolium TaxID=2727402 RepID=A0AAW2Y6Q3_9LAMI
MALLFAVSACFQFNDPDWYLWIPLYVTASAVNLVNWEIPQDSRTRKTGRFGFWVGVLLFVKVSIQGFVDGREGFWWMDMRYRVVREKFGSGLVVISMFLYLDTSSNSDHPTRLRLAKYGMPILVGVAYGLSFVFFGFQHKEMRY